MATLMITLAETPSHKANVRFVQGDDARSTVVEASGLAMSPAIVTETAEWIALQWQSVLSVSVVSENLASAVVVPPMIGRYAIDGDLLRFSPQFPLQPGLTYKAHLDPSAWPDTDGDIVLERHDVPERAPTAPTTVTEIFPTAAELPENLLKFYVHFSAPMSRGDIYQHIRLTDAANKVVELPFLEIDEELWDPEMKRITLFIDPGRIKRGVKPLEDIGPSLEQGKNYTLTIAKSWQDAHGQTLKASYRKQFAVSSPDRTAINIKQWTFTQPSKSTRDPLTVRFGKAMDHAITLRLFKVLDASQQEIRGKAQMGKEERSWSFLPEAPWPSGNYELVFANTLEDLAGNNVGKAFEVDVFETVETSITAETVRMPFAVE